MDQTTDTADNLTETEKYLGIRFSTSKPKDSSDSSSDDDDKLDSPEAHDALLGGIRTGLKTMTRTAKSALSTCKSKTELDDAIGKIQESSLRLLKLEKSFLKTASIVSEVVDDLVSDFDEVNDDSQEEESCMICGETAAAAKCGETSEDNKADKVTSKKGPVKNGSGDAKLGKGKSKQQPYVFLPSQCNLVSLDRFKDKLKNEYHKRMEAYKSTLTDEVLKEDKKFEELLQQIKMGKDAAESGISKQKQKKEQIEKQKEEEANMTDKGQNETAKSTEEFSILSSIPFTREELQNYPYKPYSENEDMDLSVLPSMDPTSKKPISFPVKNRFCNHVFDKATIYSYMAANPKAKCPVYLCRNKKPMEIGHFVADPVLTTHVRKKNNF